MEPMRTDPDCIFCKIVAGEIPAVKVLESDDALAFMDVGPVAEGHLLLIPKDHCQTLDLLSPQTAASMFQLAPRLVSALRAATGCEGVNLLQNNGAVAGQVVPHVHIHLIPRTAGGDFRFNWPAGKYPDGKIEEMAQRIQDRL